MKRHYCSWREVFVIAIQPIGELELLLTDRIIINVWRLKWAMKVERHTMEWEKNYQGSFDDEVRSELYQRVRKLN